ncbi:MAG TPA: PilX N-terminal domain-containing pilus assembly protein, partial [Tahibacter sp.]|nr:PilX N-terminal domain-containing pilus assembly protein [Tahibacter sp.]
MSMKRFDFAKARQQRGAVLFVAMIFLILITVMAVTASWNSVLQERMTGGMRNRQLGMLGAESAL